MAPGTPARQRVTYRAALQGPQRGRHGLGGLARRRRSQLYTEGQLAAQWAKAATGSATGDGGGGASGWGGSAARVGRASGQEVVTEVTQLV